MSFDEKVNQLCEKYGVSYFSYSKQDLNVFTTLELKELVNSGLVKDKELYSRLMKEGS